MMKKIIFLLFFLTLSPSALCRCFIITPDMIQVQCKYESRGDPDAISKSGALGLCQFMPSTWDELSSKYYEMGLNNPFDPFQSLLAAHIYMNDLYERFSFIEDSKDRYKLALASYNAGYKNVMEARKFANDSNSYDAIISKLPEITGRKNGRTTFKYVQHISDEVLSNYDA